MSLICFQYFVTLCLDVSCTISSFHRRKANCDNVNDLHFILHLLIQSSKVVIRTLLWKQYGKTFIKRHRLHPDTYVQMAIQLADFKLHKRYDAGAQSFVMALNGVDLLKSNKEYYLDFHINFRAAPTYETASTRQFYHGRTDTVIIFL